MDYSTVTEGVGELVSSEAAAMMRERYQFVAERASGLNVLEVSCGAGQGLGYTAAHARAVIGADITIASLLNAQRHYRGRIPLFQCDAEALPFVDGSFDIVAIHEAIYYYRNIEKALREAQRVLRPSGRLFISTINPAWSDFNPSPFSTTYFDAEALATTLRRQFPRVELFGAFPVDTDGMRARVLSLIKRLAVAWRLIPRTMKGKRLLKRLVFGKLVQVPAELPLGSPPASFVPLGQSGPTAARFKVIYAIGYRSHEKIHS